MISESEQQALWESHVAVAGLGGVGGRLATRLAAMGIGGFSLADLDTFSETNINRQEGATHSRVGRSKVSVISKIVTDTSPGANIRTFENGVQPDNVEQFFAGASVVVDGTDYTVPSIGLLIARQARSSEVPVALGVELGFGAFVTCFMPGSRKRFEDFLGIAKNTADPASGGVTPDIALRRWVPHIPRYAEIATLKQVETGEIEAPAIAPAVDLCAAMLSTLCFQLIVGERPRAIYPRLLHCDVREGRSRIVRYSNLHHYWSAIRAATS